MVDLYRLVVGVHQVDILHDPRAYNQAISAEASKGQKYSAHKMRMPKLRVHVGRLNDLPEVQSGACRRMALLPLLRAKNRAYATQI